MNTQARPETYIPKYRVRGTEYVCRNCQCTFIRTYRARRFLCADCQFVEFSCLACNKDVLIARCRWEIGRGKFCSKQCANAPQSGRIVRKKETHHNWKGGVTENKAEYQKEHRENNRPQYALYTRIRNYRKKGAVGAHTLQEWEDLKKFYNYMCLCCKKQEPFIKLTEDHIIPIIMGGSNTIDNIQPLCRSCNSKKHTKTIDFRSKEILYEKRN